MSFLFPAEMTVRAEGIFKTAYDSTFCLTVDPFDNSKPAFSRFISGTLEGNNLSQQYSFLYLTSKVHYTIL